MFNLKYKKIKKKIFSTFNSCLPAGKVQFSINSGFTLLELMLSVAIIGIISGFSIPFYQSFQVRNDLDVASSAVVQSLRRAQVLSSSVDGDSSWGVNIVGGQVILFRGSSYVTRDLGFEEEYDIPSVTVSGLQEIVFAKFSGYPLSIGTTTLTSIGNETRNITINEKGTISY